MNSKKINKIFTNSESLTREEINIYRETTDEKVKQSIEEKSLRSDFDSDALEGWADNSIGTSGMKSLDKTFSGRGSRIYLKIIGSLIVFTLIIISYSSLKISPSKTIQKKKLSIQHSVIYEKTDVVIPEEIELMNELPIKEQIKISTIQKDFIIQKQEDNLASNQNEIIEKIETSRTIQQKNEIKQVEIVKNQSFGKEVYLVSMKLIDYRAYRSRPTIKTETFQLNNTPASQENEYSKEEDVSNWKVTEIPYIEYIEKTMSLFSKGNYKKALSRFELILDSYPTDINANFYGGLSYFNLGEFEKSIQTFEKCLNSEFNNFNEEAEWYLAKSYSANGQNEKASQLFKKISENDGYYSKQALKFLK